MVRKVHKYANGGKVVKEKPPITVRSGTPGVSGAIKDAIGALGKAAAPKSVTQRKSRIDKQIEDAGG